MAESACSRPSRCRPKRAPLVNAPGQWAFVGIGLPGGVGLAGVGLPQPQLADSLAPGPRVAGKSKGGKAGAAVHRALDR